MGYGMDSGGEQMKSLAAFLCLFLATSNAGEGDDLIGTKPPEWQVTDWVNSKPLKHQGVAPRK